MSAEVADLLDRAADRIEPEGAWTQGLIARDRFGRGVDFDAPAAVSWCALGGISVEAMRRDMSSSYAISAVREIMGDISIWNDAPDRTQAEVVAALREAARRERRGGAMSAYRPVPPTKPEHECGRCHRIRRQSALYYAADGRWLCYATASCKVQGKAWRRDALAGAS